MIDTSALGRTVSQSPLQCLSLVPVIVNTIIRELCQELGHAVILYPFLSVRLCVCVRVCVCDIEREGDRLYVLYICLEFASEGHTHTREMHNYGQANITWYPDSEW